MNSLLELGIEAHGGLQRWSALDSLLARLTVRGALFEAKLVSGLQEDVTYEVNLRKERVTIDGFGGGDRRPSPCARTLILFSHLSDRGRFFGTLTEIHREHV